MKLSISRSQVHETDRKGRSQGVVFQFRCQVVFDQEELAVIEKYSLLGYPMVQLRLTEIRNLNQDDTLLRPERLVNGWSFQTRFAGDAHHVEDCIKDGCSDFKDVMKMLVAYGGDEEVVFD